MLLVIFSWWDLINSLSHDTPQQYWSKESLVRAVLLSTSPRQTSRRSCPVNTPLSLSSPSKPFLLSYNILRPPAFPHSPVRTLSVPPCQWLCGFLHLSYIRALRRQGHSDRYLKGPAPGGLCKCHVATWEDDICGWGWETALKYLLLPAVTGLKREEGGDRGIRHSCGGSGIWRKVYIRKKKEK